MLKKTWLALAFTSLAFAAFAQQPGIKRTPLQKIDFPEGYTTVTAIAEVPPGGAAGRHTPIPASRPVMCWRARSTCSSMDSPDSLR